MSVPAGAHPRPGRKLPAGFGVVLDRSTRVLGGGSVLLGGRPLRLVRLAPAGAAHLHRWRTGSAPGSAAARLLARRLIDAGLAHPRPPTGVVPRSAVTVVVPVRDRQAELDRCLAALDATGSGLIVVDDGSRDQAAIAAIAARHGARIVRHERSRGPGAARNSGLRACATPLVAFVDSDCRPTAGWLDGLAAHLADPAVGAVAPRIVAAPETRSTWIGRFEAVRSPLDMGPHEGAVAAVSRLRYVPSATLAVRRAAAGDGFDEAMPLGEDIDLVWRMIDAGWTVRYDPAVTVEHAHRDRLGPWLRRRFAYGTSAAPLARRHPGTLAPAVVTPVSAAVWVLVAVRRPGAALGAAAIGVGMRHRRLGARSVPLAVSAQVTAASIGWSGWSLAVALTRSWLPAGALAAITSRRARRTLLAGAVAPRVIELARGRRDVPLPVALTATALDDAAYAAGLWWGCLRERTAAPLLPRLVLRRRS